MAYKTSNLNTPLLKDSSSSDINKAYDYLFKILLIGDASVGKSSILSKYINNTFNEEYTQTVGVDFKIRSVVLDNDVTVKLQIWDTTGQQRFRTITASYYKSSHIFCCVYDICNNVTFQSIETHLAEIEEYSNEENLFCTMIIGNKTDLDHDRIVTFEQGKQIADKYNIKYFECSAKTGLGIESMFKYAAQTAVQKKRQYDQKIMQINNARSNSISSSVSNVKTNGCCILL